MISRTFCIDKCNDSLLLLTLITHHNYRKLELESEDVFNCEIEVDENYFEVILKGKRGRGAGGKVPVLGLLKRGGRVSRSFQMHLAVH